MEIFLQSEECSACYWNLVVSVTFGKAWGLAL